MGKIWSFLLLSTLAFTKECYIAISIGHTPQKYGATSARGVPEYQFNRKTALSLYYTLQNAGIRSFFVNADENEISLKERVRSAASYKATHFISIHHDSVKEQFLKTWMYHGKKYRYSNRFKGYSLFVSKKNPYFAKSFSLAQSIGKSLRSSGMRPSTHHAMPIKGESKLWLDSYAGVLQYDNLVVLKRNHIPALLIECGVIVHQDEEKSVQSLEYIHTLTSSITQAFIEECL
jgi:N-acetylmuramoyl-L-alanine amidase